MKNLARTLFILTILLSCLAVNAKYEIKFKAKGAATDFDMVSVVNQTTGDSLTMSSSSLLLLLTADEMLRADSLNGQKAYPNPFVGSTRIRYSSKGGAFVVNLADASGKVLFARRFDSQFGVACNKQ